MENQQEDREYFLSEEILIVQHSGEIPEVAYHGSIYYLTEDPEGPGLILLEQEVKALQAEVVKRYMKIIRRDLTPALRDKSMYRGVKRCMANWRRLIKFCRLNDIDPKAMQRDVQKALTAFLIRESEDVSQGKQSSINCKAGELMEFVTQLGIPLEALPAEWPNLCPGR